VFHYRYDHECSDRKFLVNIEYSLSMLFGMAASCVLD